MTKKKWLIVGVSALFALLVAAVVTLSVILLTQDSSGNSGSSGKTEKENPVAKSDVSQPKETPPLDMKRIAADEKLGIKFSDDKKTLVRYNRELMDAEYTIPNGVTAIGPWAFTECKSLRSVTIPSSVTTLGAGAFGGCGSVKAVPGHPAFCNDASGALIDRKQKMLLHLPSDYSGAYTIPEGITTIGSCAFYLCENLTRVTIPNSVTTIKDQSFQGCHHLTRVNIPSSVKSIERNAFLGAPCVDSVKRQFSAYRGM